MSRSSQGNRGRSRGGGAQRTESRMSVPGRAQASSSPMSEDGNEKELLKSICQLHRQIRADHTPAKDIGSAIGELKTEIKDLISELNDSEENTEAPQQPAKSNPGVTASSTNKSKDLYTVATTTKKKCRKLNRDLLETRKKLNKISELAATVGQEVGVQPDTSNADKDKEGRSFNATEALAYIKQRNTVLSEELNNLRKNIESYSTDKTEQQPKQPNDKNQQSNRTRQQPQTTNLPKNKKDHKSSQFDTNLEIISKVVSRFDDLQQYKSQMGPLVQSTIRLCMWKEDNPINDESVFVQLGRAVKDIDVDLKNYRHLESEYRKLNQQLDILGKKITTNPTCLNAQQQPEETKQKENKLPKSIPKGTDKPKHVKGQRENKEDRNESREGKKESREAQNEASGQISPFQCNTNLQIVSETVEYVDYLQDYKITLESKLSQVLNFALRLEEMNAELIGSVEGGGALNPTNEMEAESKKDEERSKRKEEGHDGSKADPPVTFDNRKFEQAIKLLPKVYEKLKDELRMFESKLLQVLDFAMGLEEGKVELTGSEEGNGKMNPSTGVEARNKKDKEKSKRKEKGHDDSNAAPPVGFDNRKFEQAIQLLTKVYGKMKDELSTYEQMLNYVWRTTNAAAFHVKELTSNNKGPGKFQIVKVKELQRDEIDQFNQLVVNMIKAIEGLVDTRSGDEIQKLKREIEIKVKENEALHNRLSKLAGNKMTEGNPHIANLGDRNRPTNIADVYSEIYDNEWTDTLDVCLTKLGKEYSEDDALQALNKTLMICYKICQEKSDEWIQKKKVGLERCSRELMVDIQIDEILMQIIEGRKIVSDQMSEQLLKEIRPKKDLVATKYAKEMNSNKLCKMIIQNKFFEKCFTLCWKMIVQNPQMILVEGPSRGKTYDRTIFREFTSSGSKVVFTVWPALYLHKDGPLLKKGVLKVE